MDIPDSLSHHPSLSSIAFGRSSGLHPVSAQLLYIGSSWLFYLYSAVRRGSQEYITHELVPTSPAVSRTSGSSNFDSFMMGGRWLYSYCFVRCCFQDLFNIARSILVSLPLSFFSIRLVSVHVMHPYCSIDTTAATELKQKLLKGKRTI